MPAGCGKQPSPPPVPQGSFRNTGPAECPRACLLRLASSVGEHAGADQPLTECEFVAVTSDKQRGAVADEPSLFRKDVEEDPIGQGESRRGAVLEVNLEVGHITAHIPQSRVRE